MDNTVSTPIAPDHNEACLEVREFRRLKYFYGQMLGAQDFQTEQEFFREKLKLHNRCLHGYGVVCGLIVEPVPIPKDCTAEEEAEERALWEELEKILAQKAAAPSSAAAQPVAGAPAGVPTDLDAQIESVRRKISEFYRQHCKEEPRTQVRIECGMALDCEGNELIVRRPLLVDLVQRLSAADYQRVKQGADKLYVSLCYCEQPVDPARPVLSDACGVTPECVYGKLRDGVLVQVTADPPERDKRCEPCCAPCEEKCLLLAEVVGFCPGHPLHKHQIHNDVRRTLSRYFPTTITGISWHTGHDYTPDQAQDLMGTRGRSEPRDKGLEIRFSRPVRASTIRPGVMDIWVIEGGRTRRGMVYRADGEFVDKPADGLVDHIIYRDTTGEELEAGDRVVVVLLADFILDECCRPVNGTNVGGKVPMIRECAEKYGPCPEGSPYEEECLVPPKGYLPWTSGNGTPGGTFVSWFYICEEERDRRHGERQ